MADFTNTTVLVPPDDQVIGTPDDPGDPAAVQLGIPAGRVLRTPRLAPVLPATRVVVSTGAGP
jgi:hypothetical protein